MVPRCVVVQALVAGLQLFAAQAVSFATVHCTQVPDEQTPLPEICEQSASTEHGEQVLVLVLHSEAVGSLQSAFPRQATQAFDAVLQTGLAASLQSVLARQPTQALLTELQTGFVESLQSAFPEHSTQVFDAVQTGFVDVVQSVFFRHSTHLSVGMSQTDVEPPHMPLQGGRVVVVAVVPPADVPPAPPVLVVPPAFVVPPASVPPSLVVPPLLVPPFEELPPLGAQLRLTSQSSARLLQPAASRTSSRKRLVCGVVVTVIGDSESGLQWDCSFAIAVDGAGAGAAGTAAKAFGGGAAGNRAAVGIGSNCLTKSAQATTAVGIKGARFRPRKFQYCFAGCRGLVDATIGFCTGAR